MSLDRILETLERTRSMADTAKILGCTISNISHRLSRQGIDFDQYADFRSIKDRAYESIQARLANSINSEDIQKAPLGSKVLAICQLEDKIRLMRNQSTNNIGIASRVETIDQSAKQNQEIIARLAAELGVEVE